MNHLNILLAFMPIIININILHIFGLSQHSGLELSSNSAKPNGYCKIQLDLVLLVDESASISGSEWNKLIPFLKKLVRSLNIEQNGVHLSLVTYATAIRRFIGFLDPAAKDEKLALEIIDKFGNSKPANGWTYTGQALTFVRESVFPMGGRKNVPKAIILVTDGASTEVDITVQVSSLLHDDGVTILVVGVGKARTAECRSVVGCPPRGTCPSFVKTNWNEMIGIVGGLMAEVCETIPKDAVCDFHWSMWSKCNVRCGTGTRARKIMGATTIVEETIGSSGKPGRTCKEQEVDYPEEVEGCTIECEVEDTGGEGGEGEEGGGGGENEEWMIEHAGGDVIANDISGDEWNDNGDEISVPNISEEGDNPIGGTVEDIDDEYSEDYMDDEVNSHHDIVHHDIDAHSSSTLEHLLPSHHKVSIPNAREGIMDMNANEMHLDEENKWKEENRSEYNKDSTESQSNESSDRVEGNTTKIAGGVIGLLLVLGAGGGYMLYKKKNSGVNDAGDINGDFAEGGVRQTNESDGGETYTVADLDDGLWGVSN